MTNNFNECPFCPNGETEIIENKVWNGKEHEVTSVKLIHECIPVVGEASLVIDIKGKNKRDVIQKWNERSDL